MIQAQPALQWQKTIGGNNQDILYAICSGSAGGILLGGGSTSNSSGEKNENSRGGSDFWVVALNAAGQIQWQRTIGGGDNDSLFSAAATNDDGWITGGISSSDISGEKTENTRGGGGDFWIVKLDQNGNIQWQKTIGGNRLDVLRSIQQTDDGGYIAVGPSQSDVSGEKTEPSRGINGSIDYWILKLDSTGTIEWQKTYGGENYDNAWSVIQTSDLGYLVGGFSASNANYDKTENCRGNADYWVLKLDADGMIQWQRTLGGSENDHLEKVIEVNGGYLLGGHSFSEISGDKTSFLRGEADFWVIKLNPLGGILWQKTIGGEAGDFPYSLQENNDGTILIAGESDSNISWEKSENARGISDMWVLNLSPEGEINWQKTIGGSAADSVKQTLILPNGELLLAGNSRSPISGEKAENARGETDYWIVKLEYGNLSTDDHANAKDPVTIYPNPTNGIIKMNHSEILSVNEISLYNMAGQQIQIKSFAENQLEFEAAAGVYLLKVKNKNGQSDSFKIIRKP